MRIHHASSGFALSPLLSTLGLSLLVLSCGCSPAPAPLGALPPVKRVLLAPPAASTSPEALAADKAAGTQRLVFDEREAWLAPLGARLEIDLRLLPGAAGSPLRIDFGVTGTTSREPAPATPVFLEMRLESDRGSAATSTSLDLDALRKGWSAEALSLVRRADFNLLVLRSSLTGASPGDGDGLQMCFHLRPVHTPAATRRPNVLLVSVDTLRADHLGCYGYARPTSPNVDRLAQHGVLFEQTISAAPWTLPSYASLFTGLYPAEHRAGIVTPREDAWGQDEDPAKRDTELLRDGVVTLAEILRANGYETTGFTSNPFLDPRRGLGRGFDRYVGYESNARNGVDLAAQWIDAAHDAPWFLFLHLMDPHFPYAPPPPFDERFAGIALKAIPGYPPSIAKLRAEGADAAERKQLVDLYDGAIAFADQEIGRLLGLLEARGLSKDTLVVFHSDHGEEFWEHGGFEHGHAQYQELLRVPLILSFPARMPQGKRIASRVRTVDVMPTILELAGIAAPEGIAGQSLLRATDADRDALAEGILHGRREIKAQLRGAWKVILAGASDARVFDLARDPGELHDLAAESAERSAAARAELLERRRRLAERARNERRLELDPASRTRLGGMGYTGMDGEEVAPVPPQPK